MQRDRSLIDPLGEMMSMVPFGVSSSFSGVVSRSIVHASSAADAQPAARHARPSISVLLPALPVGSSAWPACRRQQ